MISINGLTSKGGNMKTKKALTVIFVLLMCATLMLCLCACGDNNDKTNDPLKPQEPAPKPPTAAEVISARQTAATADVQNYDFSLNLNGNLAVGIIQGSANANYEGQYRFTKSTNQLSFKRVTSGALLYDSQEYIVNEGSSRVKIKTNEKGVVKKVAVQPADDDGLTLINLPFVALVDALDEENLSDISFAQGKYDYSAKIKLTAENPVLSKLYSVIGKMDTDISLKDVTFTNLVSGITFNFDLDNGKLTDFSFSAQIQFPVKSVQATLTLTYSQKANNSTIKLPTYNNLLFGNAQVAPEVTKINQALQAYKTDAAYSIDLKAENDFDPGWNVNATVDKYTARMYKHTYDNKDTQVVAFNKSFYYKNHTEQEGKETYKFTDGNVLANNAVWRIERHGVNKQTQLSPSPGADSYFDEMTSCFNINSSNVDCIEKTEKNGVTTLAVHINDAKALDLIKKIIAMVNSNPTQDAGIIKAENYLDETEYTVQDAEFVVVMSDGKLNSIKFESKIVYTPSSGDYSENNITLKNLLEISFNDELEAAQKYTAPDDCETKLGSYGLNNAKFYIL